MREEKRREEKRRNKDIDENPWWDRSGRQENNVLDNNYYSAMRGEVI
jgi:hypothetical protein